MAKNKAETGIGSRGRWLGRMAWLLLTLVVLSGLLAWLVWLPPNGENINRISTDEKVIALTFDDGPNPPHTEAILKVLETHGAKATFFMTGERIAEHPETVKLVVAAGNELGNHGVDGTVLAFRSRIFIESQIGQVDAALRGLGCSGVIPFRASRGMQFFNVASVLRAQGRPHIGASAIGRDWREGVSADAVARRLIAGAGPGAILSLHDGDDTTSGADRSATVEAVSKLLDALGGEYRFVTISELRALER